MWLLILLLNPYLAQISEGCKKSSVTSTTMIAPTTTTTTATELTTTTVYSPNILTDGESIKVMEGGNFTLHCTVDSLDGFHIVWKKKDNVIVSHNEVYKDNIDVENTENGSSITVNDAEEEDGGDYVCQVSEAELTHTVKIILRPEIVTIPESGLVVARVGDNVTLGCNITRGGGPGTFISWKAGESGYPLFWGKIETIPNVQTWTSGVFYCSSNNDWPEPAVAEIRIEVEYPPETKLEVTTDYTWYWTRLQPVCKVEAYPAPTSVEWFKDGEKITDLTEDLEQRSNDHHKFYAKVDHLDEMGLGHNNEETDWTIEEDKLGVYECRVKNYLGESSAKIEVFKSCDRITQSQCYRYVKDD